MSVTEQTMSRMLARLERHGYVARVRSRDDRRRHVVTLLPDGTDALRKATNPALVESMATAGLSPAQVAALRDALVTMLTADDGEGVAAGRSGPGAGHPGATAAP
jgi:DNA-binding MarR family transcriptional regulator